jgi:membrane-anchored protein YejM (alkaline phosphatase superfamily)
LLKNVFGCCNEFTDYSSGLDLFNLPAHRGLIIKSYNSKSYIIDNKVYYIGVILDIYDINNISIKYNEFNHKEIEKIKESEIHFLTDNSIYHLLNNSQETHLAPQTHNLNLKL